MSNFLKTRQAKENSWKPKVYIDTSVQVLQSTCEISNFYSGIDPNYTEDQVITCEISAANGAQPSYVGRGRVACYTVASAGKIFELVECNIKSPYQSLNLRRPLIALRSLAHISTNSNMPLLARLNLESEDHRHVAMSNPYFVPSQQFTAADLPERFDLGANMNGREPGFSVFELAPSKTRELFSVLQKEFSSPRFFEQDWENTRQTGEYVLRVAEWPQANEIFSQLGILTKPNMVTSRD